MAEPRALEGLAENQPVEANLLCFEKSLQTTKNGSAYLALVLGDSAGRVPGRVWDEAEHYDQLFQAGDVIRFRGRINSYQGRRQVVVNQLRRVDPSEVDLSRFVPASPRDLAEMEAELERVVETLGEPFLSLCRTIFKDSEIRSDFCTVPAAQSVHHAYLGGLLEHTLSVVRAAEAIARLYPDLHRDLLLSGALLHDLGKTREYALSPAPTTTTAGRLVGHIIFGVEMIKARMDPDFPAELADELIHLIISHHGQLDFGSPKTPQTLEAVALNLADDLDAKMVGIKELLDESQEDWTAYSRLYGRYFYKGSRSRTETSEPLSQAQPPSRPEPSRSKSKEAAEPESDPGLFGEL